MEGDGEANLCYYCLHELHLLPSQVLALPRRERAFLTAAVSIRVDEEARRRKELARK